MELRAFLNDGKDCVASDEVLSGLSAAQKAAVINRSRNTTLAEKHRAMREITDTLPDETIQCTDFETEQPFEQSLHALLRDFIAEQERLEEAFFATEPEVVYAIELRQPFTGEHWKADEPSLSWEACAHRVSGYLDWERRPGPWQAEVTKYYPKVFMNGFMRQLTAYFNEQYALLDISSRMQMTVPKYRDLSWCLDNIPIGEVLYAPIPFRKGDILEIIPEAIGKLPNMPKGPLLLMDDPNPEWDSLYVFCFDDTDCTPPWRSVNPQHLKRYEGSRQSLAYRILREISSALLNGDSLRKLNLRLGAALTYCIKGHFGNR